MREFVILCFGIIAFWACGEEPDCNLGVPASSIKVNFYNSEDSTVHFMEFIGVTEESSDQVFYTSEDSLASFELNLNATADQITYVFVSSTAVNTLTLGYTTELEWLSEECGPVFNYDNLEVISSTYTYEVASAIIDHAIDENIKIYN